MSTIQQYALVHFFLLPVLLASGCLHGGARESQESPTEASVPSAAPVRSAPKGFDTLPYAPPGMNLIAPPPLPPVTSRIFAHGSRDERKIALTFDACSTRKPSNYDEKITGVLVETGVPATIFLGGKWMEEEPQHTKYLASLPHIELGNHTFLHPHLTQVSEKRIREELLWTQEVMYTLTGRQAIIFRPPYGEYDERVLKIAAEMGLRTIEYDLPSGDPDVRATKEKLIRYVTSTAQNGAIIVMHINRRGWHTAEALPEIISTLRGQGFTFVTVGELISQTTQEEFRREKYIHR